MFEPLDTLSTGQLRSLAALLRQAGAKGALPIHLLQQVAGAHAGQDLGGLMHSLYQSGWRSDQLAEVVEAIARSREQAGWDDEIDLVLSGPELPGVPTRDTSAVLHGLFSEAEYSVLVVGYAFHRGERLFAPLVERRATNPSMSIRFCLDIPRKSADTSLSSEIIRRFLQQFEAQHWPWRPLPEIYFDPRSLEPPGPTRSSLHAKCAIVDRRVALITSANFTEAAQERNIECGIVVRHRPVVERLADYFDGLIATKQLIRADYPTPC